MKAASCPDDASIPEAKHISLGDAIKAIKKLMEEERKTLTFVKAKQLEAAKIALQIGCHILSQIKQDGPSARTKIAEECGFTTMTAYNYEYLARGAIGTIVLEEHADLSREYFQWIGRSIMGEMDMLGLIIRHNLLALPVWTETKFGDKRPHAELIVEIGSLLQAARKKIEGLGVLYVYQDFTIDGDGKEGGEIWYVYSCREEDEQAFLQSQRIVRDLFADISALTGWSNRLKINVDELEEMNPKMFPPDESGVEAGDTHQAIRFKRAREVAISSGLEGSVEIPASQGEKVIHGRSELVLKNTDKIAKGSVDVVITDPPYSDEYYPRTGKHTTVQHEAEAKLVDQAKLVGSIAKLLVSKAYIKPQFVWFSFFPIDFLHVFLPPILDAFEGLEHTHQVLVWDKTHGTPVGGHQTFTRQAEAILYVNVGNKVMEFTSEDKKAMFMHPNIIRCPTDKKDSASPFWKPIALLERLIKMATYDRKASEQIVLDPFAGSGSTGVAAIHLGRDYRLIECQDDQFKICQKSIAKASAKKE